MTNTVDSFSVNLTVMKTFSLYTPKTCSRSRKIQSRVIFVLLMFHIPVLGILYFILEDDIDMQRVSDNGFVLAEMCCYIPKLSPFVFKAELIRECINYFQSPVFVTVRKNQKTMIETSIKICKRNSLLFLICLSGGFFVWVTKPFFVSEYRLPIDLWLPFNFAENRLIYYSTYAWIALGAGYPAIASAVIEPLIAGLACLAAAHLQVLKDSLQNLYEYEGSHCGERIKECIKYHSALLKFAQLYQECFSQVVFSQFVGSIFVLGFCCLRLSMLEPLSAEFLSTVSYLFILLAQIYFYCYYGTSLFEESNTLTDAIYMGQWYNYDKESKKLLAVVMERSKRPIVITAGKLLDLSLETFTTILKRSYSLLAVLNNQK